MAIGIVAFSVNLRGISSHIFHRRLNQPDQDILPDVSQLFDIKIQVYLHSSESGSHECTNRVFAE